MLNAVIGKDGHVDNLKVVFWSQQTSAIGAGRCAAVGLQTLPCEWRASGSANEDQRDLFAAEVAIRSDLGCLNLGIVSVCQSSGEIVTVAQPIE